MSPISSLRLDPSFVEPSQIDAADKLARAVLAVGAQSRFSDQLASSPILHPEWDPERKRAVMVRMHLERERTSTLFFVVRGSANVEGNAYLAKVYRADSSLRDLPYEIMVAGRDDRRNLKLTLIPRHAPEILMPMSLPSASAASPQSR